MHTIYVGWFVWGFWNLFGTLIIFTPWVKAFCYKINELSEYIGCLYICGACWSNVIWLIMGAIWRWGAMGKASTAVALERPSGLTDEQWSIQEATLSDAWGL